MSTERKRGRRRPMVMAVVAGWLVLSGLGLAVGGLEGQIIVGVSGNLILAYTVLAVQGQREAEDHDDPDTGG